MSAVWLIIGAVLIAAEMLTLTFYLLWIGIGAWAAAAVSLYAPDNLPAQLLTAAATASLLLLLTRPIARKVRRSRGYRDPIDELAGREGRVISPIAPGQPGIVKVDSETWSAVADAAIEAGETVEIVRRGTAVLEVRRKGGETP
ncbi:NfeD family protein [Cohnella caldifontis]|uniref:NfeD family protein n=1 Tax=Cohnella caldifontis TaxID=3027471 RepID=UPI0023ECE71D|nr:NfeD family protein [Cohnella sp. YIM B05605]